MAYLLIAVLGVCCASLAWITHRQYKELDSAMYSLTALSRSVAKLNNKIAEVESEVAEAKKMVSLAETSLKAVQESAEADQENVRDFNDKLTQGLEALFNYNISTALGGEK